MEEHPQVIIVGGPNGSGKSTIARNVVPAYGVSEFVNADVIARGLSAAHPETVAFQAGRIMLARLEELAAMRNDFAFETTLSARTYAATIQRLCDDGWVFRLILVTLRSAALAVERVKNRVAGGGHSIPEEDIRRRFSRAHRNFHQLYMPLASTWVVYDNSPESGAIPIAFGKRGLSPNIIESESWTRFCEANDGK
jgi:predicted ABC-type ATPase